MMAVAALSPIYEMFFFSFHIRTMGMDGFSFYDGIDFGGFIYYRGGIEMSVLGQKL